MYVSRIDGDVITYDIRMKKPNGGDYLANGAMHTFEHLFATYSRNSEYKDSVIYVGPMGCRTGFYLLMRGNIADNEKNLSALKSALKDIIAHEGQMPGAHRRECGNYRCLSVTAAKREAEKYLAVLEEKGKNISFSYNGDTMDGGI